MDRFKTGGRREGEVFPSGPGEMAGIFSKLGWIGPALNAKRKWICKRKSVYEGMMRQRKREVQVLK